MGGSAFARVMAVIVAAVAATAAAVHLANQDTPTGAGSVPETSLEAPRSEPLRAALQRCRELGEAAIRDQDCLAAWDENRRRFLNPKGR